MIRRPLILQAGEGGQSLGQRQLLVLLRQLLECQGVAPLQPKQALPSLSHWASIASRLASRSASGCSLSLTSLASCRFISSGSSRQLAGAGAGPAGTVVAATGPLARACAGCVCGDAAAAG